MSDTSDNIVVDPSNIVVDPSNIVVDPSNIVVDPSNIVVDPSNIVVDPSNIVVDPSNIVVDPSNIVVDPSNIVVDPSNIVVDPSNIVVDPSNIVVDPSNIVVDPDAPTYKWTILAMKVLTQVQDYSNVVVNVTWLYECNYMNITKNLTGSIDLELQDPTPEDPFTPYEDLTETEVINWVINKLGPQNIDFYNSSLLNRINQELAPQPHDLPLPWSHGV